MALKEEAFPCQYATSCFLLPASSSCFLPGFKGLTVRNDSAYNKLPFGRQPMCRHILARGGHPPLLLLCSLPKMAALHLGAALNCQQDKLN